MIYCVSNNIMWLILMLYISTIMVINITIYDNSIEISSPNWTPKIVLTTGPVVIRTALQSVGQCTYYSNVAIDGVGMMVTMLLWQQTIRQSDNNTDKQTDEQTQIDAICT